MHELLAPIYFVIHREAIKKTNTDDSMNDSIASCFDPDFVAHDTWVLFQRIMVVAKTWFQTQSSVCVKHAVHLLICFY